MAREIPEVVRAAAGLAATMLDEARKLPETLPALPIRVIGLAMQQAMKLQQHYAGLVARGDELFTGVRGEDEPGLATFDDDDEPTLTPGFRDSAFDRAAGPADDMITDAELPPDAGADAMVAAAEELAEQVEGAQESLDELADQAPATEEILDEPAVDGMPGEGAGTEQGAATGDRPSPEAMAASARAAKAAPIVVHEGAEVVDDDIGRGASPSETGAAGQTDDTATLVDEGSTPVAVTGPGVTAPVEGYDDFSIAQLRGRLRGYAPATVEILIAYEQANRARDPYLRMLGNRLERLQADNA